MHYPPKAFCFRPRRLTDTTGPGPRNALLFLFPCADQHAGFLCLFRKKRRDAADLRPNGLCPFQGFGCFVSFFLLAAAREKESERLGAYRIAIFTLCVLGSMLIDGFAYTHCNFTQASVHSWLWWYGSERVQKRMGHASPGRQEGRRNVQTFSARDYYLLPGRTGQTFWDRNGGCEYIRRWTGGSKPGCVLWERGQRWCLICVQVYDYWEGGGLFGPEASWSRVY